MGFEKLERVKVLCPKLPQLPNFSFKKIINLLKQFCIFWLKFIAYVYGENSYNIHEPFTRYWLLIFILKRTAFLSKISDQLGQFEDLFISKIIRLGKNCDVNFMIFFSINNNNIILFLLSIILLKKIDDVSNCF